MMDDLNPNLVDPGTLVTTLHRACYDNQFQIVDWCIEKTADIEARSMLGRTPLHMACDGDAIRCIRLLLEHRADANSMSLSLMTPLHIACQSGSYEAVMVLLDGEGIVDVNSLDSHNRTADLLTKDKRILRMIDKYRTKLDQARKQDLLQHKLRRLFKVFDRDGTGLISVDEWNITLAKLANYFESSCECSTDGSSFSDLFSEVDANSDQAITWDEFRDSAVDMLEAVGMNFKTVMASVADLENAIFEETCAEKSKQAALYMSEVAEFAM